MPFCVQSATVFWRVLGHSYCQRTKGCCYLTFSLKKSLLIFSKPFWYPCPYPCPSHRPLPWWPVFTTIIHAQTRTRPVTRLAMWALCKRANSSGELTAVGSGGPDSSATGSSSVSGKSIVSTTTKSCQSMLWKATRSASSSSSSAFFFFSSSSFCCCCFSLSFLSSIDLLFSILLY